MKIFFYLIKFKLTFFVSISALSGYFIALRANPCFADSLDFSLIFAAKIASLFLGILVLSSGSAALNQVQEYKSDGLMQRTRQRPIPSGKLSVQGALFISVSLILLGLALLTAFFGFMVFSMGLLAIFFYNGIYTNLKRGTTFSLLIGAIVGVIPPLIGFFAGGGLPGNRDLFFLLGYLFLWQVAHTMLLLIVYRKDFEKARFFEQFLDFSEEILTRIACTWILSVLVAVLIIISFRVIQNWISIGLILLFGAYLLYFTFLIYRNKSSAIVFYTHRLLNFFTLSVMFALIVDKII